LRDAPGLNAQEAQLFADIAQLGIAFDLIEHAAVFTVEESSKVDRDIPGAHTKNLFLKDAGGQFWLVTVPADMRVDLKSLPQAIGCKRVSFAKADDMFQVIGVTPGSVTPLASIYDTSGLVTVVLDEALVRSGRINVHPLRNTATIGLSPSDLIRLLRHCGHDPVIATIPAKDATLDIESFR
jgi:Ala-tRNA(Pro) deacylase